MSLLFGRLGGELEESIGDGPETGKWIYWGRNNRVFLNLEEEFQMG